ncbi:unnamed protein product [Periconia digitata]|uniref:Uncharacterized protein n=1 Tax=Periconia digitata TaxID=1303443 RepID=A0A9W4UPE1_9PLEO|nr:unnamed protein product [Periconia digitata]
MDEQALPVRSFFLHTYAYMYAHGCFDDDDDDDGYICITDVSRKHRTIRRSHHNNRNYTTTTSSINIVIKGGGLSHPLVMMIDWESIGMGIDNLTLETAREPCKPAVWSRTIPCAFVGRYGFHKWVEITTPSV